MPQNSIYIISVDSLRTSFTLTIFLSAINSIDKFNIYAFNARSTTRDLRNLRNKNLNILPKTGVDATS